MIDRKISATSTLAYALWSVGAVLIGLSFVLPLQLAAVGLLLAGMGGVTQIRGMFCGLAEREREAYRLGQESAGMRSVR